MDEGLGLLEKMRLGVDYRYPITIRSFTLLARPLSIGETAEVATETTRRMQDISRIDKAASHTLNENIILAQETLVKASTSDVGANDPKITPYVMSLMTSDEITELYRQYVDVVDRCNPALETMKPSDVKTLVDDLKKNLAGDKELALRLTELSRSHLLSMAHYLLSRDD